MNNEELTKALTQHYWGPNVVYIKVGDKYYKPTECKFLNEDCAIVIETEPTNLKKTEKQSGITVRITARELFDRGIWMEACELTGLNDWAISEGRMDYSDIVELTEVQAKQLGIFNQN